MQIGELIGQTAGFLATARDDALYILAPEMYPDFLHLLLDPDCTVRGYDEEGKAAILFGQQFVRVHPTSLVCQRERRVAFRKVTGIESLST